MSIIFFRKFLKIENKKNKPLKKDIFCAQCLEHYPEKRNFIFVFNCRISEHRSMVPG